jgi:hypothetical protein
MFLLMCSMNQYSHQGRHMQLINRNLFLQHIKKQNSYRKVHCNSVTMTKAYTSILICDVWVLFLFVCGLFNGSVSV